MPRVPGTRQKQGGPARGASAARMDRTPHADRLSGPLDRMLTAQQAHLDRSGPATSQSRDDSICEEAGAAAAAASEDMGRTELECSSAPESGGGDGSAGRSRAPPHRGTSRPSDDSGWQHAPLTPTAGANRSPAQLPRRAIPWPKWPQRTRGARSPPPGCEVGPQTPMNRVQRPRGGRQREFRRAEQGRLAIQCLSLLPSCR